MTENKLVLGASTSSPFGRKYESAPHTCSHRCHDDDLKAVDNEDDVMGMEIISVMLMKMMTW